jgi:ribonuclease P protein component
VVFLAPGDGEVAAVASGKVGGAVQRNRARRVIRAALREVAPSGILERDVVVVARSSIRGATSTEVAGELRTLLSRAGSRA